MPDSNNPRHRSEKVAELLNLSLRKFGLLSPIYITEAGLILSGHQRTSILKSLGDEFVYACILSNLDSISALNGVNFAFNKELQEIASFESPDEKQLDKLYKKLKKMPDIKDRFHYLKKIEAVPVSKIKPPALCSDKLIKNSELLYKKAKVIIPIILDKNHNIINGIPRYFCYSRMFDKIPCIIVPDLTPEVFRFITAQYSFKGKEDNIRLEQRRHVVDYKMGKGLFMMLFGKGKYGTVNGKHFSKVFATHYLKNHMQDILDFGSGNGKQTILERKMGLNITLFEPFAVSESGLSLKETHNSLTMFLDRLEDNKPFDLVKASAVLNSVPFRDDARKVVVLLKFLSIGAKALIVSSRSVKAYIERHDENTAINVKELGDYTFVSSGAKTKVQTFYTVQELVDLFVNDEHQGTYDYLDLGHYVFIRVDAPQYKINFEELMEAVDFEFGIKYYGRTFEDIKSRAKKLFTKRYNKIFKTRK